MRKILVASVLLMSVAAGPAALAGTKPAKAAAPPAATASKEADCAKQWKAEKKHTQTRKAFLAACSKA